MSFKLVISAISIAILSGCAFTVHDLPVNYQYSGEEIVLNLNKAPEVSIEDITDDRNVENPRMIMNMKNGYGQTTSGGWQAEKDLALIVKDALDQGISKAGLDSLKDHKVSISGQLVDVSSSVVSGWSKGTVNVKIAVKLTAKDPSGRILWRDTVYGDSSSEKVTMVKDGILQALNSALDNLVRNFLTDDYFHQQVLQ
ncbi:hypothetical protein G8764_02615 [Pseudomaricurvus alcaniphilus]|uniref:YajG family lipoprotein n=1 Tax=Pseudomaricurvus alcaniphilus TaxID=1166482 RepID=UPI00140A292A|nr:YajG family lipoprotein [Pseudomaricurvus alcaniphilus]NHN36182.1 hypothetical protein [Pseudomaricurvus alcaniphilus]